MANELERSDEYLGALKRRHLVPALGPILLFAGAALPAPVRAQATSSIPLATRVELRSEILGETRTIEIAVPDRYEQGDESYPEAGGRRERALESYREALERSRAIHYGQEEEYAAQIERLESLAPNDR